MGLQTLPIPLSDRRITESRRFACQGSVSIHPSVQNYTWLTHIARHDIDRPIQEVDYCCTPGKLLPFRKPYVAVHDPPTSYRCPHCPKPKDLRLWKLKSLLRHLSDKWVSRLIHLKISTEILIVIEGMVSESLASNLKKAATTMSFRCKCMIRARIESQITRPYL